MCHMEKEETKFPPVLSLHISFLILCVSEELAELPMFAAGRLPVDCVTETLRAEVSEVLSTAQGFDDSFAAFSFVSSSILFSQNHCARKPERGSWFIGVCKLFFRSIFIFFCLLMIVLIFVAV